MSSSDPSLDISFGNGISTFICCWIQFWRCIVNRRSSWRRNVRIGVERRPVGQRHLMLLVKNQRHDNLVSGDCQLSIDAVHEPSESIIHMLSKDIHILTSHHNSRTNTIRYVIGTIWWFVALLCSHRCRMLHTIELNACATSWGSFSAFKLPIACSRHSWVVAYDWCSIAVLITCEFSAS